MAFAFIALALLFLGAALWFELGCDVPPPSLFGSYEEWEREMERCYAKPEHWRLNKRP